MRAIVALLMLACWTTPVAAFELAYLGSIGTSGPVTLNDPTSVAVAPDGSIWVADVGLGRVLHFTPDGGFLGEITPHPPQWRPSGVAVLSNGRIAVAGGNVTLHEGDGSGMVEYNLSGGCYGVAADPAGGFWVTQELRGTVLHWPDLSAIYLGAYASGITVAPNGAGFATSSLGNRLIRIPGMGGFGGLFPVWIPALLAWPLDVEAFEDRILVADTWHCRLLEFDYELTPLDAFGAPGSGPGQFLRPSGLAVAPDGTLYVSELDNNRVSVYGALPVTAGTSSWGRIKTLFR